MNKTSRIFELLGDLIPRSLTVTNSVIDWQAIETDFADLIQPYINTSKQSQSIISSVRRERV